MTMTLAETKEHYGVREWGFKAPIAVRLLRRVEEDENGCWLYVGSRNQAGYGTVHGPSRPLLTHRVMYWLLVGEIPDDRPQLDHLCRVRACCNPQHLDPVTHQENFRRGLNATKTECAHGHPYTPENTYLIPYKDRHHRACRACQRFNARVARVKNRSAA